MRWVGAGSCSCWELMPARVTSLPALPAPARFPALPMAVGMGAGLRARAGAAVETGVPVPLPAGGPPAELTLPRARPAAGPPGPMVLSLLLLLLPGCMPLLALAAVGAAWRGPPDPLGAEAECAAAAGLSPLCCLTSLRSQHLLKFRRLQGKSGEGRRQ